MAGATISGVVSEITLPDGSTYALKDASTREGLRDKVSIRQGAANAGKVLYVNAEGNTDLMTVNALVALMDDSPARLKQLVAQNLHSSAIPVGEQYSVGRATSTTASVGESTGISAASVDLQAFVTGMNDVTAGTYTFCYSGSTWRTEGGTPVLLSNYGIAVTGTSAEGDTVTVTETAETITLDVADHDKCCASGKHSLVLKTHNLVASIAFKASQLLITALTDLPAGKYRFTLDHGAYNGGTGQDGTYYFTTTQTIPAGGGIKHSTVGANQSSYTQTQITNGKITTYGPLPQRNVIQSNLTVALWNSSITATDLGTATKSDAQYRTEISGLTKVNYTVRNAFGNDRYALSDVRQWLNSAGKAVVGNDSTISYWWTAPADDPFAMPPVEATRKMAGFLYGLEPAFVAALGNSSIICELPSQERTEDSSTLTETLQDRVFLPSKTDLFGGTNISTSEGSQLGIYVDDASRIATYDGSATQYWTRSSGKNYGFYPRTVKTNGQAGNNRAYSNTGVLPCFVITG